MPKRILLADSSGNMILAQKKLAASHYGTALKSIAVAFYTGIGYYGIRLKDNPTNISGQELLSFWLRKFDIDSAGFTRFAKICPSVRFNFDTQCFEPTREQHTFLLSKDGVQFCFDFALRSLLTIEDRFNRLKIKNTKTSNQ
ncbi:MAG TPA: hypothetical protein PKV16_05555 [Caldisericia bacterium]|nr:hypothetical protein [Caldisericia bacterium]HPF48778.1 hypothetical protein [Caldisericia bacterium]HPI83562.1 hypothetical protein [Caldisericia bacterium]HPQ93233.1 hypothetical protein [Caldisericia bacterium]HRV74934.1 hypothetical protein [Caldisericia bacterium]